MMALVCFYKGFRLPPLIEMDDAIACNGMETFGKSFKV